MPLSSIYLHIIFRTKSGTAPLKKEIREKVYRIMISKFPEHKSKVICINGVDDHIHIIAEIPTVFSLPDLIHKIKLSASVYIKAEHPECGFKGWNRSYAVFSCSKRELPILINYVENQEIHHANKSTADEVQGLLEEHGVDYNIDFFDW